MFSRGSYTVKKLFPHNKVHEPITISLLIYFTFNNCNKLDLQPNNYRFLMFIFLEYQKQKEEYWRRRTEKIDKPERKLRKGWKNYGRKKPILCFRLGAIQSYGGWLLGFFSFF